MNAERKIDGRGTKRSRLSTTSSWGAVTLLSFGFLVSALIVSSLLVGSVAAAGRFASFAGDPEIARLRGLAGPGAGSWAVADESVHLRGLVEAALSGDIVDLALEAEIARLRGLAGPGAGSWAVVDESVHLRGLAAAAGPSHSTRSRFASAARYNRLASHYGRTLDAAISADAARWQAKADCYLIGNDICSAK